MPADSWERWVAPLAHNFGARSSAARPARDAVLVPPRRATLRAHSFHDLLRAVLLDSSRQRRRAEWAAAPPAATNRSRRWHLAAIASCSTAADCSATPCPARHNRIHKGRSMRRSNRTHCNSAGSWSILSPGPSRPADDPLSFRAREGDDLCFTSRTRPIMTSTHTLNDVSGHNHK